MVVRRSPLEICIHIMRALRDGGPMLRTHLMYKANLRYNDMTEKYLPELFEAKLIEKGAGGLLFLTPKGLDAMGLLERGIQMIGPIMEVYPRGPLRTLGKKDSLWTT